MRTSAIIATGLLASAAAAAPSSRIQARETKKFTPVEAVTVLLKVAPDSKTCDAKFTKCRNATEVAIPLAQAMLDYKFNDSPWEMAAIISLTAHESDQFRYKAPADPKQAKDFPLKGTSNMQSAMYNLDFAKSLPQISKEVNEIVKDVADYTKLTDLQMSSLLTVLQDDKINFASGAWFLRNKCKDEHRNGIVTGTRKGWVDYISNCVGVKETQDDEWKKRETYWVKAVEALNLTVKK